MNQYFFDIDLISTLSEEYISLITEQRNVINKLLQQGVISNFALSSDRTKSWLTVSANSEEEAIGIVDSFPLRPFMSFSVHPLIFQLQSSMYFPQLSLN